jgi:hypothetical protein
VWTVAAESIARGDRKGQRAQAARAAGPLSARAGVIYRQEPTNRKSLDA